MVMLPEPWGRALDDIAPPAARPQPRLVVPTPSGRPFSQALATEFAHEPWLLFACGRYEGIDARVPEYAAARMRVDEVSIGDYVLAGGEAAVLVIVEAVTRLIPASWATRTPSTTTPSLPEPMGCSRRRSTPSRPGGVASTCPPCCCPAITLRSPHGGPSSPGSVRLRAARICCEPSGHCRRSRYRILRRLWHHEGVVLTTDGALRTSRGGAPTPVPAPMTPRAACPPYLKKVTRDEHPRWSGRRLSARGRAQLPSR